MESRGRLRSSRATRVAEVTRLAERDSPARINAANSTAKVAKMVALATAAARRIAPPRFDARTLAHAIPRSFAPSAPPGLRTRSPGSKARPHAFSTRARFWSGHLQLSLHTAWRRLPSRPLEPHTYTSLTGGGLSTPESRAPSSHHLHLSEHEVTSNMPDLDKIGYVEIPSVGMTLPRLSHASDSAK